MNMKEDAEAIEKAIGKVIRRLRVTKTGLSHVKLSSLFEINRSYLGEIERGEKEPGIRILDKLARGFGLELSELMILVDKERKRIKEGYVVKTKSSST